MNNKYEMTNDFIEIGTRKLYRIKALKDFNDIKAGDIGGYIENESNLSHEGDAWVYGNAEVYGNAKVYGNARIYGDALVYGNARVYDDGGARCNYSIGDPFSAAAVVFTKYSEMFTPKLEKQSRMDIIKKVIFNDSDTIVFWSDGTKTVVKVADGEKFDPEKGLAMAISKHFFGDHGYYYDIFKKWLPKDQEK